MSKSFKSEIQVSTLPFPYTKENFYPQSFYHHSGNLGASPSSWK